MPKEAYPNEDCRENRGIGWTVKIIDVKQQFATISFSQARDTFGRKFAPIRVRRSLLIPLEQL